MELMWVRCRGCAFTMFRATIGFPAIIRPGKVIEIKCRRCDLLNRFTGDVIFPSSPVLLPDGAGGFLTPEAKTDTFSTVGEDKR